MPERRHVRLFRNGRNQAVRIPVEFELPGDEAIMHRRRGDRISRSPSKSPQARANRGNFQAAALGPAR